METFDPRKALFTTQITPDEARAWFAELYLLTDKKILKEFPYYFRQAKWPILAQKKHGASRVPLFTVHHHTSNPKGNHKPALHRFFTSKKASAHFVIGRGINDVYYLVGLGNLAYHASHGTLPIAVRRILGVERGWLNEIGFEVAGNGGKILFSSEQFKNVISIQRYLNSYYPTIREIKSHRFFSPVARSGDPGPLYFLPLVEHACFTDISLSDAGYWLEEYKKDPILFANKGAQNWIKELGIEDRDEWFKVRERIKVTEKHLG